MFYMSYLHYIINTPVCQLFFNSIAQYNAKPADKKEPGFRFHGAPALLMSVLLCNY